ncbi:unnamed protein product [Protopolystoma xenopodis]|uniref:Uncharacterized protein n=1 Tax=Protopolystoma xenopodis TaxID=117903 RepID=A0A3S5B3J6_9PLAT|nr:unnamed protein product [Protopolystoma xenopodis]
MLPLYPQFSANLFRLELIPTGLLMRSTHVCLGLRLCLMLVLLFILNGPQPAAAQFPRVCAWNLTRQLPAICCPVPEGKSPTREFGSFRI